MYAVKIASAVNNPHIHAFNAAQTQLHLAQTDLNPNPHRSSGDNATSCHNTSIAHRKSVSARLAPNEGLSATQKHD
jgi:hypothetical protein